MKNEASVIGLGTMGTTLARLLLQPGHIHSSTRRPKLWL